MKFKVTVIFLIILLMGSIGTFYYSRYYFTPQVRNITYPVSGLAMQELLQTNIATFTNYVGKPISNTFDFDVEPGAKVTRVFHFWAGWCDPCINEMPEVLHFIKAINKKNVSQEKNHKTEVYLISLDANRDDLEKALKIFPDLTRLSFIQIWDQTGVLSRQAAVEKLPITFIDRPGVKMQIHEGAADWKTILSSIHAQAQL